MTQPFQPTSMRTFIIVWIGQMVSTIGSYMTNFAITIWAWEITGQATALALVGFFTQIPRLFILPLAGVIVDRWNRKFLMILGDSVAGFSTVIILVLYLNDNLQIWHLYITGLLNGTFGQIQEVAYSATISTIVPKKQYSRASAMGSMLHYGSAIIAPAIAGTLYYIIHLLGILVIDLTTFAIAISTILFVYIPKPAINKIEHRNQGNIQQQISFGFRYILARRSLLTLLIFTSLFQFAHDIGAAIYSPMILARTDNNAVVLGSISSAAGIGGVVGAIVVSIWGGPKLKIHGVLLGMLGAGLSKTIFGLGRSLVVWLPTQFCSSLNFPLMGSSRQAILLAKVEQDVQGRVFAVSFLIVGAFAPFARLIAGPLADYVLEPAMMPGGTLARIFGNWLGTGAGAGMALLYVTTSICLFLIGCVGYTFSSLREVDTIIPDHDVV